MSKKPVLMGISAMIAASFTLPVLAQDEYNSPFEEIVVTASKRAQTLQEVPIAVSVVTSEILQKAQIRDIKDLQSLVPSLRVTQLQQTGNTNFVIRGFGNGANNVGIEPSVGVFIDGVYRSRSSSALADLPNLERIEVLRGPQSTLFGKNASAGVISVITAKPDLDAFGGSASLTVGDFSEVIVKADITGPLSDTVAFSLSGNVNQRDGYFKDLTSGGEYNEHDRFGLRGQLLFQPSDNLEFRFIVDHDEIDEACCGVANLVNGPTGPVIQAIGGQILPESPFSRSQFFDFAPVNEIENSGVSLQIDYDYETMTLTSITSFRNQSKFENGDVDFTSARLIDPNSSDTDIDTFTQEIRLASSGQGAVDWMIGGFYFDEDVSVENVLTYGADFRSFADILAGGIPGNSALNLIEGGIGVPQGTFFAQGQGRFEMFALDNQAFSIFGQLDIHMMDDRVTLTLGANYTEDEKDARANMVVTDVFSGLDLEQVGGAFIFAAVFQQAIDGGADVATATAIASGTAAFLAPIECSAANPPPGCNALLALRPLQFMPPFLNFPNSVENGSTSDDEVTWTARLAFNATDNVNIYFGAATGFKASSWNLSRDSRPFAADLNAINTAGLGLNNLNSGTRFAGPEDATVYEVGLKARFDRGSVNIAIFDQEIEGFQSNLFLGTGFVLANAGKQSTKGVELEAKYAPIDDLRLSFAGTWLDPKYDSFPNASGVNGPVDLSGTKVPGVHEFSMNLSGIYSFDFGSSMSGFVRAEYIFDDKVPIVENVPTSVASREVSTFNASIGIEWDNGFEAMLWGRNLNNDD
ncbi:MAG: TonB-dependent receptor [Proteobacteria bacterium]|nr:TonB-dependent receptor [Pseudomonadota bacterium]